MEKRLGTLTLGVRDLAGSRAFYEQGLGWTRDGGEDRLLSAQRHRARALSVAQARSRRGRRSGGQRFSRRDAGLRVRERDEVEGVLEEAQAAGGRILVAARDTFWGSRDGYFADPDGHLWEVQWNSHLEITARGEHLMKRPA